jgi:hypothetical protein
MVTGGSIGAAAGAEVAGATGDAAAEVEAAGAEDPGRGAAGAAATGAAGDAAAAPASVSITAITCPTGMVSPSWARISTIRPAAGEGISESTLSVEMSRTFSSRAIKSPTFFVQRTIVPSVMLSPIWGMTMSIRIRSTFPFDPAARAAVRDVHRRHGRSPSVCRQLHAGRNQPRRLRQDFLL